MRSPLHRTWLAQRTQRIDEYKAHFANPYIAAERGYIDDVIIPHETRPKLIEALQACSQTANAKGSGSAAQGWKYLPL